MSEPTIPTPAKFDPQTGDWVAVLYWRVFVLPGQPPNSGSWDTMECRVVSTGPKVVVVEVASTTPARYGGDEESLHGSTLRFAPRDRVFPSVDDAKAHSANLKAPV